MNYSNIECGLTNFSACTLSYYDIHTQAVAINKAGDYDGTKIADMPPPYQRYINGISKHEIYGLQLKYSNIYSLYKKGYLKFPLTTESSTTCFQRGEDFHPKLDTTLYSDTSALNTIGSCVIPFYSISSSSRLAAENENIYSLASSSSTISAITSNEVEVSGFSQLPLDEI